MGPARQRQQKRQLKPVEVQELTGVERLALGRMHACALRTDGTVMCWGNAQGGQLGDGTSGIAKAKLTPTQTLF